MFLSPSKRRYKFAKKINKAFIEGLELGYREGLNNTPENKPTYNEIRQKYGLKPIIKKQ